MSDRKDMELIAQLVPPGSRVLDLGCGNGELLAHLRDLRQCSGYGVEIADANVLACTQRGVDVLQLNIIHRYAFPINSSSGDPITSGRSGTSVRRLRASTRSFARAPSSRTSPRPHRGPFARSGP